VALPLAWYYAVTLVLPLANGAARAGPTFGGHALVVLAVPPILIVVAVALHTLIQRTARAVRARATST
jgi:hypothetical protein